MTETTKIAIVGAGSLRGRELNEVLSDSSLGGSEFLLLDDEAEIGTLEAVGDEVTFMQRIEASSFAHTDFVFFTGDRQLTLRHWESAHRAGASLIDESGALEGQPGVLVRAPWLDDELAPLSGQNMPGLETPAVVPAHPVAVALALMLARITQAAPVHCSSATVLEPASEYGRAAIDELHQQTVKLLGFQDLPRQVYDSQVAFNTTASFGESARVNLAASESRIRHHFDRLSAGRLPEAAIQLLHTPVFHGYGISLAVELARPVTLDQMESSLAGDHVEIVTADSDPPTNVSIAGQTEVMVRIRPAAGQSRESQRFWIWAGLDNLRFAALNAVSCALELKRLRPSGKVQ